jgi:plastocyanin
MRPIFILALAAISLVFYSQSSRPAAAGPRPADDTPPRTTSQELTGSVRGTISSVTRLKTRGDTSERDLVVSLRPKGDVKAPPPPAEAVVVRQAKLQFQPHVQPVQVGARIAFTNEDTVTHNVFSTDDCCKVDHDMAANERKELVFPKAGVVPVVCRLHPDMSLWVIVLEYPWFTTAEFEKVKAEGAETTYRASFSVEGLPPGEYTLTTWNKKLAPYSVDVVVTPQGVTDVVANLE